MAGGILVWCVFTPDGRAPLHMNSEQHPDSRTHSLGGLLSPDVSSFHEICNLDNRPMFHHFPESGIAIRYRIRLRYPEEENTVAEQSGHEPETCVPAWLVPERTGRTGLYLWKVSEEKCFIPDMAELPGLPELQPDGVPVRVEMLIREASPVFDRITGEIWNIARNPGSGKEFRPVKAGNGDLTGEGVVMWTVFTEDGKAALYMDGRGHIENGMLSFGERLSLDVPVLHGICNLKEMLLFRHFPGQGVPERIRMRLQYPGSGKPHEPEACFPVWIVPEENGRTALFLQNPSIGECAIRDISRVPGAPRLQPDGMPVGMEMLVRQADWFSDMESPALRNISNLSANGEAKDDYKAGFPRFEGYRYNDSPSVSQ